MAILSERREIFSVIFGDPGADDKQIHLFRTPANQPIEILAAFITVQNAQASGSAGEFQLEDWGTDGTSVEGTIAVAIGGTAVGPRIAASTPEPYVLTDGTVAAATWVVLDYQETGDFVEQQVTVTIEYIVGFGANA